VADVSDSRAHASGNQRAAKPSDSIVRATSLVAEGHVSS